MKTKIKWEDLEAIYVLTLFNSDGTGRLKIASQELLDTLLLIERDETASEDANLVVIDDHTLELDREVLIQFSPPRISLGRFVPDFARLIAGPTARVEEPEHYFVVDGRLTAQSATDLQLNYRAVLRLVALLRQSAAYQDRIHQELVFFRDGKVSVPVTYGVGDIQNLNIADIDALLRLFDDPVHQEQKLAILSEAVVDLAAGLLPSDRFACLIRNIRDLSGRVSGGYRLFISSFSYSKIRRDVESAQAEYLTRIHKTFVDLQGQILGIPVATVIVASQLKEAKSCGVEAWTNIAIVVGSWIFVLFLLASIVNQWMTLDAISREFRGQQSRLLKDFSAVSDNFNSIFLALNARRNWHRVVFVVVGTIGIVGATFATIAASKLTHVSIICCI